MPNSALLGSPAPLRFVAHPDQSVAIPDNTALGSSMTPKDVAYPALPLLTLDFASSGPSLLLRMPIELSLATPTAGVLRLDLTLPVVGPVQLGAPMPPRSFPHLATFLPALACCHAGLPLTSHAPACLEMGLLVLDLLSLGSLTVLRNFLTLGLSPVLTSKSRSSTAMLMLDYLHPDSPSSSHVLACIKTLTLTLDLSYLKPMLSSHHTTISSLSVFPVSTPRLDLLTFVLNSVQCGLLLLPRFMSRVASLSPATGTTRIDLSLSVSDYLQSRVPSPLHSFV